jgi:ferrous iron transport protein A
MTKLSQKKTGETAVVKDLICVGKLKQRLIDMGIYGGTRLTVVKLAPLGDPMQIAIKDFSVAIRKSDANTIIVE